MQCAFFGAKNPKLDVWDVESTVIERMSAESACESASNAEAVAISSEYVGEGLCRFCWNRVVKFN